MSAKMSTASIQQSNQLSLRQLYQVKLNLVPAQAMSVHVCEASAFDTQSTSSFLHPGTMGSGTDAKVLAQVMLKYYTTSQCHVTSRVSLRPGSTHDRKVT